MIKRYKENPFLQSTVISTKKKQVKVTQFGKDNNILVNQDTGEIRGTHVVTYKNVDEAEFVKLFVKNIALTFDLKAAGIKAFNVLMWCVQYKAIQKDVVALDKMTLEEFLEEHTLNLSISTFQRGIAELNKAKIIAKTMRAGFYFVNPNFCFNGDRVAFTTAIQKKSKVELSESIKENEARLNAISNKEC